MKIVKLQKIVILFSLSILIIIGLADYYKEPDIVINEVCSNNFIAQRDEDGNHPDCIELYNPGKEEISLDGYFLTDDEKIPDKYSLEGIQMSAGGYVLVCLGKESGLRISKEGEKVFLADSSRGGFVDQVIIPRLSYDTSYGRIRDGKAKWSVMSTTLGSSNEGAKLLPEVSLDEPVFDVSGGFYEEAFELHLYSPVGERIYYTLDGSEPTKDSILYNGSIWVEDPSLEENRYADRKDLSPNIEYIPDFPVDKAVVVRAVCYNPVTNQISDIATETFFMGYDKREEYEGMPVLSLVVDEEDLFDGRTGIYGNGDAFEEYLASGGMQEGEILDSYTDAEGGVHYRYMASNAFEAGKEWERKASIAYFDEQRACRVHQNVGIRIAGEATRSRPQKSFNVYARDIYDDADKIPYAFFDNDVIYSTIRLRNGGNNSNKLKFLDAFLEEAAKDRTSVTVQKSKPCVVFLNGEYWGIYNIRERYTEEYLAERFQIDPDDVMLIKRGSAATRSCETMSAYQYMLAVVTECDLVYEDIYALADGLVDMQSLIDYYCINLYLDNRDVALEVNTAMWRTSQEETGYSDGKWRFMVYDLDKCIHPDSNIREGREHWMEEHALFCEPAFQSLMDNEGFRRQFCLSFMDIANTTFSYEKMHSMLDDWSSRYSVQVVKDHQRFYDAAYDLDDFYSEVEQVDQFFKHRFSFAMESLANSFDLSGELVCVSVSSNPGGTVAINTASLEEGGTWEGYYYSDFPITVSAQAKEGYHFAGWKGDVDNAKEELSISLQDGNVALRAVFEKNA